MDEYKGPERRKYHEIPDELIDHIAERAAERVLEKVYAEVGKNVLKKMAWIAGLIVVSAALYLAGKGIIK